MSNSPKEENYSKYIYYACRARAVAQTLQRLTNAATRMAHDPSFAPPLDEARTNIDHTPDRQTGRQADRQTDRQTNRQTDRQTDRQTGRQAGRQAGRQTNRQTDKQTGLKEHLEPFPAKAGLWRFGLAIMICV